MLEITTAKTDKDLEQILNLQAANQKDNISIEQSNKEGFVTVKHDLVLLQKMNTPYPHTIAKANDEVVAYALVMLSSLRDAVPVLVPMFEQIDKVNYKGQSMANSKYFVMGQICIKKEFRGKGIFQKLYQDLAERLSNEFDFICTEIASRNVRSIRAHQKVGFVEIDRHVDHDEEWVVVALKISN